MNNRVRKRARYRPSSSYFNLYLPIYQLCNMHILASYSSHDDDPCETLDGHGTKQTLKRSEQRNRRDPEVNRIKKRARYRPSSSYFNLYLQTSSDDDPCETLDGRGTKNRVEVSRTFLSRTFQRFPQRITLKRRAHCFIIRTPNTT